MIIITFMSQSVLGIIDFVFISVHVFKWKIQSINPNLWVRECVRKNWLLDNSISIYVDLRPKLSQTIIVIS